MTRLVDDYDVADQPEDAAAFFVMPQDGDTVSTPVEVEFEVQGIKLAPAGDPVVGEGHLHVLVDRGCFADGEGIPGPSEEAEEDGIFHFGDGQDSGEIDLAPGQCDLCLQIADGPHIAYGQSDEISITVEERRQRGGSRCRSHRPRCLASHTGWSGVSVEGALGASPSSRAASRDRRCV